MNKKCKKKLESIGEFILDIVKQIVIQIAVYLLTR